MSSPMRRSTLVAMLAISSPVSLGAETLIRKIVFTADMREMRVLLEPFLTPVAWALLGVTGLAVLLGVPAHHAIHARLFARLGERAGDPAARASADTVALYLAASVVQLPSLVAAMTFTLGAAVTPVLAALCAAGVGVVLIGVFGRRA